jgi:hypothetical protein
MVEKSVYEVGQTRPEGSDLYEEEEEEDDDDDDEGGGGGDDDDCNDLQNVFYEEPSSEILHSKINFALCCV